ncbi:hypothetical protein D3C85_1489360 [compost metagenome]
MFGLEQAFTLRQQLQEDRDAVSHIQADHAYRREKYKRSIGCVRIDDFNNVINKSKQK